MMDLRKVFGDRLVTLNTGALGLRGGLNTTVKEVVGGEPMMDFIASDETLDRYGEVIQVGGWELDHFRRNPVVPDCHDYSSIARILGRAETCEVKEGALCNRVLFCLDNPMGALAYKMARAGFLKSQSVGFIPLEWVSGDGKTSPWRTYTKQELTEISLVVVPANPGATIGAALKSGAVVKGDLTAVADFLKQFCSDPADPAASARAPGDGNHGAQLLKLARDLRDVLRRA